MSNQISSIILKPINFKSIQFILNKDSKLKNMIQLRGFRKN